MKPGRSPGAEREQREGASGKWVAHWKMVHIVRPVWEKVGEDNQLGRVFGALTLRRPRRRGRSLPARAGAAYRRRGARPRQRRAAVRQRLRSRSSGRGAEARRLLRQRRRPLPDGGHGHRRDPTVSILWEWLHKGARFTAGDAETLARGGRCDDGGALRASVGRGVPQAAARRDNRDVHDDSKRTTLPIVREIVEAYVAEPDKPPWYIDLLNLNLGNHDLAGGSEAPGRSLSGRSSRQRTPRHREPRFRNAAPTAVRGGNPMTSHDHMSSQGPRVVRPAPLRRHRPSLLSARQVAAQQGTIRTDYPVARDAAEAFYLRLRELFADKAAITTFGPYSPGQAVTMKRLGIEGHLSGGLGDLGQGSVDPRGSRAPTWRAIRSARCPTRRR